MDVSVSEILAFLRCRRAWHYQSQNRMGLSKIGVPSTALHLGSAIHAALAAGDEGGEPLSVLREWFEHEVTRFREKYVAAVGTDPSDAETTKIVDAYELADALIRRYYEFYGPQPYGEKFTVLATEQTFRVPIPGTDGHFMGTLDGLLQDDRGHLWCLEHKTYSTQPSLDKLQMDAQFTAYCWAGHALFGKPVVGVLYDGIAKKVPTGPKVLKNGSLSSVVDSTVDYRTYCEAIEQAGKDPHDYDDILARLLERDSQPVNPFYARYTIPIHRAQTDAFASYLPSIYRDMADDPAIYPNFPILMGCFDCTVKDLCHSEQHGEDVEFLIQTGYARSEGSLSFKRRSGVEVEVDAAAFV